MLFYPLCLDSKQFFLFYCLCIDRKAINILKFRNILFTVLLFMIFVKYILFDELSVLPTTIQTQPKN